MKMVLLEDVQNAGLREVGGVFYTLRCEKYFLELGRKKFYICRMF